MEVAHLFASAHPLLVHFPIVLLLLAVGLDLAGWWRENRQVATCGYWCMLGGTLGAVAAFVCGILAELYAARSGVPQTPIESHEWLATFATWLFLGLAVMRLITGVQLAGRVAVLYLLLGVAGCGLLVLAAHRGGQVVYDFGGNVGGVQLQRLLTDEDLARLAQHQDEATLQYSNQMHWIFGGIVIALAFGVLLERLPRGNSAINTLRELRRFIPFVFIGGGIYLSIFSDWDSWPLSNLRSVTDPEVLLHKFIALLLIGMGLASWLRPRHCDAPPSVWQNRVVAVAAVIGGGLLFTHVHTNAPYTSVAMGVYLNHTALGLVALGVAVSVLLADLYPDSRRIAMLFPLFLLIEGGLLASYNEDLPWFLGYERINHHAIHPRAVLAHIAGGRAELTFSDDGRLDVYLLDRREAAPLASDAPALDGVVEARQQPFPVRFDRVEPAHYQARVPWTRALPVFTVRLTTPLAASFDPVVTAPLLPPLDGVEKVYACPMCTDVLSSVPGDCPMCGMALSALDKPVLSAPRLPPHDADYDMKLAATPDAPLAGSSTRLRFTLQRRDGTVVTDVRRVHEKLMHLIVVSADLSSFEHVHPEVGADGAFTLDHRFPFGGRFVLFADVAPEGHRAQVFRLETEVKGAAPPPSPAPPHPGELQQIGRYSFGLDCYEALRAGHEAQLTFTVFDNGRPVDDLETYLGAVGHCIIISDDTRDFVHCHALQLSAARTPAGPQIAFHALFPRPGGYRVWAQFQHHGQVLTTSFALQAH